MYFMLVASVAMYAILFVMAKTTKVGEWKSNLIRLSLYPVAFLVGFIAMLFSLGIMDRMFPTQLGLASINFAVPVWGGFSVIAAAIFAVEFALVVKKTKESLIHKKIAAAYLTLFVGCLYIAGTVVDHISYVDDGKGVSVIAPGFLKMKDFQCPGAILSKVNQKGIEYRCMNIMLGGPFHKFPFAPWPSYSSSKAQFPTSGIKNTVKN